MTKRIEKYGLVRLTEWDPLGVHVRSVRVGLTLVNTVPLWYGVDIMFDDLPRALKGSSGLTVTPETKEEDLGNALQRAAKATNWFERLSGMYALYKTAYTAYTSTRNWWLNRNSYSVKVNASDPVYQPLNEIVTEQLSPTARRNTTISTQGRFQINWQSEAPQEIEIEGHKCTVVIESSFPAGLQINIDDNPLLSKFSYMTFRFTSIQGRDALVGLIKRLDAQNRLDRLPSVMINTRWGYIRRGRLIRTMDDVICTPEVKKEFIDDAARFLQQEQEYEKLGMVWRRGYLLTGPPGSGKSSLAQALASKLEADLNVIIMSSVASDDQFAELISDASEKGVVLLEDFDRAILDSEKKTNSMTTSGLLNILDGAGTRSGRIIIGTANNPETLEPALIRPGRFDKHVEVGPVGQDEVCRFIAHVTGWVNSNFQLKEPVLVADLVEVAKQYIDDSDEMRHALESAFGVQEVLV